MCLFKPLCCTVVLGFSFNIYAQQTTYYWTDTTSENYVNHRVKRLIEDKKHLYLLGVSHDESYQNMRMSFSRLDKSGKVLNFTIYELLDNIVDVRGLAKKPGELIRIYGTATNNGNFIPYVNDVATNGNMPNSKWTMVSVPHYMGDMQAVNDSIALLTKSIRSSATNLYNTFTYKINLTNNDEVIWRYIGESDFNEESSALFQMSNGSTLVLAKRYTDNSFMNYYSVVYSIDKSGAFEWLAELEDFQDFSDHSIASDDQGIYIIQNYGYEVTGTNRTLIIRISADGTLESSNKFENINANGMICLKNGRKMLYGGVYKPDGMSFIEKGKVIYLENNLNVSKEREMLPTDAPDANLPGFAMTVKPTSSDFLTATVLKNGKIALAGRVYMPVDVHPERILLSTRTNRNLLVITNENGEW